MTSARRNPASFIPDFKTLIVANKYEAAYTLFRESLDGPTLHGIGDICQQRVPLLEALFPYGINHPPALNQAADQLRVMQALALAYIGGAGLPNKAVLVYPHHNALAEQIGDQSALALGLGGYAKALCQTGQIRQGEAVARQGLILQKGQNNPQREAVNLYRYGMGLAQRGIKDDSARMLAQAANLFKIEAAEQDHAMVTGFLAQRALWLGDAETALTYARRTWEIADTLATDSSHVDLNGIFKVRTAAARMIGESLMLKHELDEAEVWVSTGFSTANLIHMVEEMLPLSQVQTEIARQRGQTELAHHTLQLTWELAQSGEYITYDADSSIMLARIYTDSGERQNAITAAQTAYRLSWCDGPPFAYQRGLDEARDILEQLHGEIPDLPPHDDSNWPPLPEISFQDAESI